MYGIILIVGIFAIYFGFASAMVNSYSVPIPTKYNDTFVKLSNMTVINEQTEALKQTTLKEDENATSGFFGRLEEKFDIAGLFFMKGYKAVQIFPKTIGVFSSMVDTILDSGSIVFGSAIVSVRFIVTSLIIVAVIAAVLAILIKWWI